MKFFPQRPDRFSKPPKPNPSHHSMDALEIISGKIYNRENCKMQLGDSFSDNKMQSSVFKTAEGQEISKKVYELVNFLSSSSGMVNGFSSGNKMDLNPSLKNCVRHSDIEYEMLNNVRYKKNMHFTKINGRNTSFCTTQSQNFKFTESPAQFGRQSNFTFTSNFGMSDKTFIPCSPKPSSRSAVDRPKYSVVSINKIKSESKMLSNKEQKVYFHRRPKQGRNTCPFSNYEDGANTENKSKRSCDNFSGDTLKKDLQKVVADVLGKSKVNSPRKNTISKPKDVVKRVINGSGEQCTNAGLNSTNFYLPPRAFGCGSSQSMKSVPSCQHNLSSAHAQRPLIIVPVGKKYDHNVSKTLPPFWSKTIISSKSDGDIETFESNRKVGGSQENLKRKIAISACGIKTFARRPHVARKTYFHSDKNSKASL